VRRVGRLLAALAAAFATAAAPATPTYPPVRPETPVRFPTDGGAHPKFRTEWWYVTGWLRTTDRHDLGFQVTFFRTRPPVDPANPSAFAAKQVLFAHAALSDPSVGRLLHDERIAREGFGLAEASRTDTELTLQDWTLKRGSDTRYRTFVEGRDFTLNLTLTSTQPLLLQGQAGYSRKGPRPQQASDYYSVPHLAVSGTVVRLGHRVQVTGEAWLDHEWSSTLLDPAAVGWDWVGLNLKNGAALTAFQVRNASGQPIWSGGSYRPANGAPERLGPGDIAFTVDRRWRSPRTGSDYPIARTLSIKLKSGTRLWRITPMFDDQELDSRVGGGPVYWEGAVSTPDGRGYLELTGYLTPLRM